MPGEAHIPDPPQRARAALEAAEAEIQAKLADVEGRREAEIRADERAKIAAEYRGIITDSHVLLDWMNAHGIKLAWMSTVSETLAAVAGDIGSRLGGYTGRTEAPAPTIEPARLIDPDCASGKHAWCVGGPCRCECHDGIDVGEDLPGVEATDGDAH